MTPAQQLAAAADGLEGRPADGPEEVQVDQVTALYLALRARSYEEIASFVRMRPDAVRYRVHAMLAQIGGPPPPGLPAADQARLMDYVLQQLPEDDVEHHRATDVLRRSEPARAWADSLVAELRPLAPPEAFFPEVRRPPRERPPGSPPRRPKGLTPPPPGAPPPPAVDRARRAATAAVQLAIVALVVVAYWLVVTHGEILGKL